MDKRLLSESRRRSGIRQSAAQGVVETLRSSILSGEISPGAALREVSLAAELGVSRNTVREAARILESEGLVIQRPGRGVIVVEIFDEDLVEIYRARDVIETTSVSAFIALPDADVRWRRLEEIVTRLELAYQAGAMDEVLELDHEFHHIVVSATENGRLIRFYEGLQRELRLALALANQSASELGRDRDDHRDLLEMFRTRDESRACAAVRQHLAVGVDELKRLRATVLS